MKTLLAIDPGKRTGLARFVDGELTIATFFEPDKSGVLWLQAPYVGRVVIEVPRWYPHDAKDVNDLIDLAVLVGEYKRFYMQCGSDVELVFPRTWKGTVPKDVHNKRVLAALSDKERAVVPVNLRAKKPDHNVVDAVGLGLWKLRRLR